MSSTFTVPLRVFKRNNPTNDGTIAPDNTGALAATQEAYITNAIAATTVGATVLTTADVGTTTAVAYVIPAGSSIHAFRLFQTVAAVGLVGGVITVALVDSAAVTTTIGTITPTAAGGVIAGVFSATAAVAALVNNVGTSDVTLTFSAAAVTTLTSGSLAGTFQVNYTPRNADGSITAYGSGYTNT